MLRMASSGMLRRVALVRTDVSEEHSAPFIRVTIIGELGTMLAVTSNRRTPRNVKVSELLHGTFPSTHHSFWRYLISSCSIHDLLLSEVTRGIVRACYT
jgi:hypothetical protein